MMDPFPSPKRRSAIPLIILLVAACIESGCGMAQGQWLYALGLGRGQKVKAECILTQEPILILVDDPGGRVRFPLALRYIEDEIAQELLRNKAAVKIVPPETIEGLRRASADFDRRGARQIGVMAGASQVLWVEVLAWFAESEILDATDAAYAQVGVRVLDANAKSASATRLWPKTAEKNTVSARLTGSDVARLKTQDAVSRDLAEQLAKKLAKFFYDHRLGDMEKAPDS